MRLHHTIRASLYIFLVALTAAISGCASVKVSKLDANSAKVPGAAEGIRFYLPRPYVSVFEPFIIASESYLTRGELSLDGNYVLLTQVPPGLDAIVNGELKGGSKQTMGELAIDAATVIARESVSGGPQGASAAANANETAKTAAKTGRAGDASSIKSNGNVLSKDAESGGAAPGVPADGTSGGTTPPGDTSSASPGGILNYKVTNDNSAYAVTPQPRYFNILWLPDFDEQYAVTAKAGLGNAGVTIAMGQGWNLQGLDAKIDNSALAKPLLDFYSGVLGSLQKIATAKIEGPLAAISGGPQGAKAKDAFKAGTPVTVKVTKVRIVAPGLYPILKPKEMQGVSLTPEEQKRILAPKPPLTNIAFNTYDAIVIEAARTTGDSALRIHQYVDSTAPGASISPKPNDPEIPSPTVDEFADAKIKLNIALSKPENVTTAGEFYEVVSPPRREGGTIKVNLKKSQGASGGTRASLPEAASIKKIVKGTLSQLGFSVSDADISIQ